MGILVVAFVLPLLIAGLFRSNDSPVPEETGSLGEVEQLSESEVAHDSSSFVIEGEKGPLQHDAAAKQAARFKARAEANQSKAEQATEEEMWKELFRRHVEGDENAFQELLRSLTPENALVALETMKGAKMSRQDRARLYQKLGELGGGDMIQELILRSDRDAALALRGWAEKDHAAASDWLRQMDVRGDPLIQKYLADANLSEQQFLDRLSEGLLQSLQPGPGGENPEIAAMKLVETLMKEDPLKGEAMMRELTERFVSRYDPEALAVWFNQIDDPDIQSAAVQRIIEKGMFKEDPFGAVEMAFSLDSPKSRGNALSAAFGQLGGGVGGVDMDSVVAYINDMPPGRDKDFAINGFAHGIAGKFPEVALEWANSIGNEQFRVIVTRNVDRRIGAQTSVPGR